LFRGVAAQRVLHPNSPRAQSFITLVAVCAVVCWQLLELESKNSRLCTLLNLESGLV